MRHVRTLTLVLAAMALLGARGAWAAKGQGDSGSEKKGTFRTMAEQDPMFQTYMRAAACIRDAQIHLAKAFGLKGIVEMLEAEKMAFASSSTIEEDAVKRQRENSEAANAAISERIIQQQALSEEGKVEYEKSLEPYSQGMQETVKLAPQVIEGTSGVLQSAGGGIGGMMGGMKKGAALVWLIKEFKPFYKDMRQTYRQIASYAKKIEIPLPANATAVLSELPTDGDVDLTAQLKVDVLERIELIADGTFDHPIGLAAAAPSAAPVATIASTEVTAPPAATALAEPVAAVMAAPAAVVVTPAPVVAIAPAPTPAAAMVIAQASRPIEAPVRAVAPAVAPIPEPVQISGRQPLSRELDGP